VTAVEPRAAPAESVDEARPVQVYTTTVYAHEVPPVAFIAIPDAVLDIEMRSSLAGFVDALELPRLTEPFYATDLPAKLRYCLTGDESLPTSTEQSTASSLQRVPGLLADRSV
jgi:hypothetical protein